MQVFKLYFQLLNRHKGVVFLYIAIFMTMSVLLTNVNADSGKHFEQEKMDVALIDEDEGSVGQALKEYFADSQNIKEMENDTQKITDALYWKEIDYVLVIPEGFEESLKNGTPMELSSMQVPSYFDAVYFETELQQYLQKLTGLLKAGYSLDEAQEKLNEMADVTTSVESADFVNADQNDLATRFFLYAPYLFLSAGVISIGMILLRMNEKRVKERIECSACSMRESITGLTLAVLVFGLMLLLVVLLSVTILSGGSILTDARFPWFLVNILSMLLLGLSMGFFVGMVAKNDDVANGFVNVMSLALCFLGGVFVPQEFFGSGIEKVARLFPTYWYVANNEQIGQMVSVSGSFVKKCLIQSGVSVCYAIVFFAITLVIVSAKRKRSCI